MTDALELAEDIVLATNCNSGMLQLNASHDDDDDDDDDVVVVRLHAAGDGECNTGRVAHDARRFTW